MTSLDQAKLRLYQELLGVYADGSPDIQDVLLMDRLIQDPAIKSAQTEGILRLFRYGMEKTYGSQK